MNECVIRFIYRDFERTVIEMFSKKRQKQLKKFIKKAKKEAEKAETRERAEDETRMRTIARHFW